MPSLPPLAARLPVPAWEVLEEGAIRRGVTLAAVVFRLLEEVPTGPALRRGGPRRRLAVRLYPEEVEKIDREAARRGWSRLGTLTWWITRGLEEQRWLDPGWEDR